MCLRVIFFKKPYSPSLTPLVAPVPLFTFGRVNSGRESFPSREETAVLSGIFFVIINSIVLQFLPCLILVGSSITADALVSQSMVDSQLNDDIDGMIIETAGKHLLI